MRKPDMKSFRLYRGDTSPDPAEIKAQNELFDSIKPVWFKWLLVLIFSTLYGLLLNIGQVIEYLIEYLAR